MKKTFNTCARFTKEIVFLSSFFIFNITLAQGIHETQFSYGNASLVLNSVAAADFLLENLDVSEGFRFELIREDVDKIGMLHYRFQQFYNNLPIENTVYLVHVKNGIVNSHNGTFIRNWEEKPKTDFTVEETVALQKAVKHIAADKYKWEVKYEESNLKSNHREYQEKYYPEGKEVLYFNDKTNQYERCWKFNIYAQEPLSRQNVFVSSSNGEIIEVKSLIKNIDRPCHGQTKHYGTVNFLADSSSTGYKLIEDGRGIETYNLNGDINYSAATNYLNDSNFWDTTIGSDPNAISTHYASELTYDFYKEKLNRNSIDNNGHLLKSYLYFSKDKYSNAFWDGERMSFIDGDNFGSLITVDIVAHEITHGLVQYTANLNGGEANALNESYADILAIGVDYMRDSILADSALFVTGEDVIPGGIRSAIDPSLGNNPSYYKGVYWDKSNLDEHTNSTVNTHWFYILARGKSGRNEAGNDYSVDGIGINKAIQIVYRTLAYYLQSSATYQDARDNSIQAAIDLYGGCSLEALATANAWYAVGLGDSISNKHILNSEHNIDFCSVSKQVNFKFTGAKSRNITWDFGDNTSDFGYFTSHKYDTSGEFVVQIQSDGCDGSILRDSIILNIDRNIICDTIDTRASSTNKCYGILYDSGGPISAPNTNSRSTIIIEPTDADSIQLEFTKYDMGLNDRIEIYNRTSNQSVLVKTFDRDNKPKNAFTTDKITVIKEFVGPPVSGFRSTGFQLQWRCFSPGTVSISESENPVTRLSIYPNPANSHFTIEVDNKRWWNADWKLYTIRGAEVASGVLNSKIAKIEVSNFNSGLYFLVLNNGENRISQKISIQ